MKLGKLDLSHVEHAVVVGGGNTAIDAVRELLGLGIEHVSMMYRGSEEGMSGYAHEWEAAHAEGATARFGSLPLAFDGEGDKGPVRKVRATCVGTDKKPIAGSEHDVPAELVLLAIGQAKLGALVAQLPGVVIDELRGRRSRRRHRPSQGVRRRRLRQRRRGSGQRVRRGQARRARHSPTARERPGQCLICRQTAAASSRRIPSGWPPHRRRTRACRYSAPSTPAGRRGVEDPRSAHPERVEPLRLARRAWHAHGGGLQQHRAHY